jgi:hypothetical protein
MTEGTSLASIKPTLKLSKATRAAIQDGTVRLRRGQWIEDEFGTYGRFLAYVTALRSSVGSMMKRARTGSTSAFCALSADTAKLPTSTSS